MIQLEEFAFKLLNQIYDNYGMFDEVYTQIVNDIWVADTEQKLSDIIKFLQTTLLNHMKIEAGM